MAEGVAGVSDVFVASDVYDVYDADFSFGMGGGGHGLDEGDVAPAHGIENAFGRGVAAANAARVGDGVADEKDLATGLKLHEQVLPELMCSGQVQGTRDCIEYTRASRTRARCLGTVRDVLEPCEVSRSRARCQGSIFCSGTRE